MEHAGQLMSHIKTYDQQIYEVLIDGNRIKIRDEKVTRVSMIQSL